MICSLYVWEITLGSFRTRSTGSENHLPDCSWVMAQNWRVCTREWYRKVQRDCCNLFRYDLHVQCMQNIYIPRFTSFFFTKGLGLLEGALTLYRYMTIVFVKCDTLGSVDLLRDIDFGDLDPPRVVFWPPPRDKTLWFPYMFFAPAARDPPPHPWLSRNKSTLPYMNCMSRETAAWFSTSPWQCWWHCEHCNGIRWRGGVAEHEALITHIYRETTALLNLPWWQNTKIVLVADTTDQQCRKFRSGSQPISNVRHITRVCNLKNQKVCYTLICVLW